MKYCISVTPFYQLPKQAQKLQGPFSVVCLSHCLKVLKMQFLEELIRNLSEERKTNRELLGLVKRKIDCRNSMLDCMYSFPGCINCMITYD